MGGGQSPLHLGADPVSKGRAMVGAVSSLLFFNDALPEDVIRNTALNGITSLPKAANNSGIFTTDGRTCQDVCKEADAIDQKQLDNLMKKGADTINSLLNAAKLKGTLDKNAKKSILSADEEKQEEFSEKDESSSSRKVDCLMTFNEMRSMSNLNVGASIDYFCPENCTEFKAIVFGPAKEKVDDS